MKLGIGLEILQHAVGSDDQIEGTPEVEIADVADGNSGFRDRNVRPSQLVAAYGDHRFGQVDALDVTTALREG